LGDNGADLFRSRNINASFETASLPLVNSRILAAADSQATNDVLANQASFLRVG
jgi:hypothetical protein